MKEEEKVKEEEKRGEISRRGNVWRQEMRGNRGGKRKEKL